MDMSPAVNFLVVYSAVKFVLPTLLLCSVIARTLLYSKQRKKPDDNSD